MGFLSALIITIIFSECVFVENKKKNVYRKLTDIMWLALMHRNGEDEMNAETILKRG